MKSLHPPSLLYSIEPNLWIGIYQQGCNAFIELGARKKDGAILNSIFPICHYSIGEAIEEFKKYID